MSIYLLLIQLYSKSGRYAQGETLLQEALQEFSGTNEELKITMVQADLLLEKGEIDQALAMLEDSKSIRSDRVLIKQKIADIYLNYKSDTKMYAKCYKDIVDGDPDNVNNYIILGDALLDICEPEEAIRAFEKALSLSDDKRGTKKVDTNALVRKTGTALVLTHDYESAKTYYTNALKRDPSAVELKNHPIPCYNIRGNPCNRET